MLGPLSYEAHLYKRHVFCTKLHLPNSFSLLYITLATWCSKDIADSYYPVPLYKLIPYSPAMDSRRGHVLTPIAPLEGATNTPLLFM